MSCSAQLTPVPFLPPWLASSASTSLGHISGRCDPTNPHLFLNDGLLSVLPIKNVNGGCWHLFSRLCPLLVLNPHFTFGSQKRFAWLASRNLPASVASLPPASPKSGTVHLEILDGGRSVGILRDRTNFHESCSVRVFQAPKTRPRSCRGLVCSWVTHGLRLSMDLR